MNIKTFISPKGKLNRKEYLKANLFLLIGVPIVLLFGLLLIYVFLNAHGQFLDAFTYVSNFSNPIENINMNAETFFGLIYIFAFFFLIIVTILSTILNIKRLHDLNKSGWWVLLTFIPYIGVLVWIALFLIPGINQDRYKKDEK